MGDAGDTIDERTLFPGDFDPVRFFQTPTLGAAAVVDFTGRLVRRCVIETQGELSESYGALHFDERYMFDDGSPEDVMHWAVSWSGERFEAHEPSVVGEVKSKLEGCRWRVVFQRVSPATLTFDATFLQVQEDTVLKLVQIKRFGLTLARLQGFHRHVSGARRLF